MAEDTQLILQAIKTQGEKIGQLADSVDKLVEKLGSVPFQKSKNEGVWPVTTFATVIAALGSIFLVVALQGGTISELRSGHQAAVSELRSYYQGKITELRADHQAEITGTLATRLDTGLRGLDSKLQKEIIDAQKLFEQAERDSEHRHDTQQDDIDTIREYFKAPRLRNNSREN